MAIDQLSAVLLISSTVATGLSAGLLYGFACAVMPGLKDVEDRTFVAVMQSVNRRILNGWFLVTFIGAPVLTLAAAVAVVLVEGGEQGLVVGGAALLSVVSVAITGSINVPLNNALDAAGDAHDIANPTEVRARFERRWTRGNLARAAASTAAFVALVWGSANYL